MSLCIPGRLVLRAGDLLSLAVLECMYHWRMHYWESLGTPGSRKEKQIPRAATAGCLLSFQIIAAARGMTVLLKLTVDRRQ
jgi:hypothetical protein